MDTPGLRSLALWEGEAGIGSLFQDIEVLMQGCKFSDCQHQSEPGCQIQRALGNGELDPSRWASYLKLQKEESYQRRKIDKQAALEEKKKWKNIHKHQREYYKSRR